MILVFSLFSIKVIISGFYFGSQNTVDFPFLLGSYQRTGETINGRPVFRNNVSKATLFIHHSKYWVVQYESPIKSWLEVIAKKEDQKDDSEVLNQTRKSMLELELENILGYDNIQFIENVTAIDSSRNGWILQLLEKKTIHRFVSEGKKEC